MHIQDLFLLVCNDSAPHFFLLPIHPFIRIPFLEEFNYPPLFFSFFHSQIPIFLILLNPSVEYVREGFCQPSYLENDEAVARAYQEELSQLDSLEASGMSKFGNDQVRAAIFFKLVMINCQQHVGNETCQNSNSEPYNIPEAENYDPSERENGVHDIDVYGSSSLDGLELCERKF
ncbi:hypothetical protein HN51_056224 [Arachis hypogaea]